MIIKDYLKLLLDKINKKLTEIHNEIIDELVYKKFMESNGLTITEPIPKNYIIIDDLRNINLKKLERKKFSDKVYIILKNIYYPSTNLLKNMETVEEKSITVFQNNINYTICDNRIQSIDKLLSAIVMGKVNLLVLYYISEYSLVLSLYKRIENNLCFEKELILTKNNRLDDLSFSFLVENDKLILREKNKRREDILIS